MIPEFKNKPFTDLNKEQKIAFTERVCMELFEYLKNVSPGTAGLNFAKFWMSNITTVSEPSTSSYLSFYIYVEGKGLCVRGQDAIESVRYNVKECICFIQNVVNVIPFRSPIVDQLARGTLIKDMKEKGIVSDGYGEQLATVKGMKGMKKGKPVDPNSLAQRIKRGEITRYEAYQKKEFRNDDDAL